MFPTPIKLAPANPEEVMTIGRSRYVQTGVSDGPKPMIAAASVEQLWYGIDHPEGVAIDVDGLIWCGGEDGQIYCGRLDDKSPTQVATLPGRTGGLAIDEGGNAYCADLTEPAVYRITREGQVQAVSTGTAERPTRVPNFPAFLPSGELVYTDSGVWGDNDGCIYLVSGNGETSIADTTASSFPNGLAVSPDGATLAVVESALPGVSILSIGPDGSLTNRRVAVEMPGTIPDGVAYDTEGRLLVSCWAPDSIFLVPPLGDPRLLACDPRRFAFNQPTNIAFVPGSRTVIAANIGERFLSVFEHEAEGAPLYRPHFPAPGLLAAESA